jgi:WD40 repeat protein
MFRLSLVALAALAVVPAARAGDKMPAPQTFGTASQKSAHPDIHRGSVTFSPDGKKLAWMYHTPDAADPKEGGLEVHLWDAAKDRPLATMRATLDRSFAFGPIRFTPNGKQLYAGSFRVLSLFEDLGGEKEKLRNNVSMWLVLAGGRELMTLVGDIGTRELAFEAAAVTPDSKFMVAACSKQVRVWKIPDNKDERTTDIPVTTKLVIAADASVVAGTGADKAVHVYKTADGKEALKLPNASRALGFAPDGKRVAVIEGDKIAVYEVDTGKQLWAVSGKLGKDADLLQRFDWSADGKHVAWNDDGRITVAGADDGKTQRSWMGQPGPVALSPDGGKLALAAADGTALMWDLTKK